MSGEEMNIADSGTCSPTPELERNRIKKGLRRKQGTSSSSPGAYSLPQT